MHLIRIGAICLSLVVTALGPEQNAMGAGTSCGRAKVQAARRLADCRAAAWRRADRLSRPPATDLAKCDAKFTARWQILDGQPDCLTVGDEAAVHDEIASCLDEVAGRLVTSPKVIFTTAALWHGGPPGPGEFTYVSGADVRCQETADAVPALQGKTWKAWLSGADPDTAGGVFLSARDRITHSPGPYVRTDGVLVAVDFDGLTSGSLLAPLERDEHGASLPDAWGAWTGTETDGSGAPPTERCRNGDFEWNNSGIGVAGRIGNPALSDANWTNWRLEGCQWSFHLYCIEQ
jgi:hypothetical protein